MLIKKILTLNVILLFIGVSIQPAIAHNEEIISYNKGKNMIINNAQTWEWAKSAGGKGRDFGFGIVIDNNDNTYITGLFNGSVMFGNINLISKGYWDVFIAKLDSNGIWKWAKSAGGKSSEDGCDIAMDNIGNVYITGSFNGSALFGTTSLTSQGEYDIFIAKLDTDGIWQWAISAGGINYAGGYGVTADNIGNVYIIGGFNGSALFGTTSLTSQGLDDVFVTKLDTDGNWQWAKRAGGKNFTFGSSVAVDNSGNVYITGIFSNYTLMDNISLFSQGSWDVFVAKLNSDGIWKWAKSAGGNNIDYSSSIALDNNGNVFITGSFIGVAWFYNITLRSQGQSDVFIAKLDTNGIWKWAKSAGGPWFDEGAGVWTDINGYVYITGCYQGKANFGSTSFPYKSNLNVFIAKLDSKGTWYWANSAGGKSSEEGCDIAVDKCGNVYITGYFNSTALFGDINLTAKGREDIFIAMLSDINQPPEAPNIQGPSSGILNYEYEYIFNSTDPNLHPIMYFVDWGDNNTEWTEFSDSGDEITLKHIWENKGTYLIKAKSKDIYDAESNWSEFEINIPRTTATTNYMWFHWLLERFPLLERLLNLIRYS